MRHWRPPFHASPVVRKGSISSKRVSSQDPLLRKFWNFNLYSLNFHPYFSSQPPKFGNFQLRSPKFDNFQFTSPPFKRQISVGKPHTSEIQAAHPYLKKSWVPPWHRHFTFNALHFISLKEHYKWTLKSKAVSRSCKIHLDYKGITMVYL